MTPEDVAWISKIPARKRAFKAEVTAFQNYASEMFRAIQSRHGIYFLTPPLCVELHGAEIGSEGDEKVAMPAPFGLQPAGWQGRRWWGEEDKSWSGWATIQECDMALWLARVAEQPTLYEMRQVWT